MHFLNTVFDQIWERKNLFLVVFFVIFMLTYGVLYAIDFVPETPEAEAEIAIEVEEAPTVLATSTPVSREVAALPKRVVIKELGTDVPVLNPKETSIAILDEALLQGVVRHPESASFATTGTMFLFGHSSYLPVVHNKNFQAFNGIQKLDKGDEIEVYSDDMVYVYHVARVSKVAASETEITLKNDKERLILVTCNSFGSKDDRFMVEAELVEKRAL